MMYRVTRKDAREIKTNNWTTEQIGARVQELVLGYRCGCAGRRENDCGVGAGSTTLARWLGKARSESQLVPPSDSFYKCTFTAIHTHCLHYLAQWFIVEAFTLSTNNMSECHDHFLCLSN